MISRSDLTKIKRMQRHRLHRIIYSRRPFEKKDQWIKDIFKNESLAITFKFECLIDYFWEAHKYYCANSPTLAYYPGETSIYGCRNDAIEGVTRLLPLWAAYISSPYVTDCHNEEITAHLMSVLCKGTDPSSILYWGDISDYSTLICEAADVALALWLAKDTVWPLITQKDKNQILGWLEQAVAKKTADNNWHLFSILIDLVLNSFREVKHFRSIAAYDRIKFFYLDDGCFKDGPEGQVDLYNAWSFHYVLFWINKVSPNFDPSFIKESVTNFCSWYQYLFTENGVPLFGRSLCYRMATPVPLLSACDIDCVRFPPGMVLNALYTVWQFFIAGGALKMGRPTQGVFSDNSVWLDPYSGPASSFWATRSIVMFYYLSRERDWSNIKKLNLPVNSTDFTNTICDNTIRISTEQKKGLSVIEFLKNSAIFSDHLINKKKFRDRLREVVYATASRPANNLLEKDVRRFDSTLAYYQTSK